MYDGGLVILALEHVVQKGFLGTCVNKCASDFASRLKACSPRSRFSAGGSGTNLASTASGSASADSWGASSTLGEVGIGMYEDLPFPEACSSYLCPIAVIAIPLVDGK